MNPLVGLREQRLVARARNSHAANAVRWLVDWRGQRDAVVRRYAFDLIARHTRRIAVDSDGLRFYVDTDDKQVARGLFARGPSERGLLTAALDVLAAHGLRDPLRGRGFLDVGANIGTATCIAIAAHGAGRAWAFEPAPRNLELLALNVDANGLRDRVVIRAGALSDADGRVELELDVNSGDHRVRTEPRPSAGLLGEEERPTVTVTAWRLDTLVERHELALGEVGLAWLDVQGHEASVLDGATALLHSEIPIVCEYWPYGLRRAGALERFHELVTASRRQLVDLGARRPEAVPGANLVRLGATYRGLAFTDLLLLPPGASDATA